MKKGKSPSNEAKFARPGAERRAQKAKSKLCNKSKKK